MNYAIAVSFKTAVYYKGDELFQHLKSNFSSQLAEKGCPSHGAVCIYNSQQKYGGCELQFPSTLALVNRETGKSLV
jgi:hypothetical protein